MGEQTKNMLIGVFIIVACSIIVSIIMFLKPTVGDGKQTLYVRFANINQIGVGTRVTFAGKPVGEVVAVDEIFQARKQPTDILGRVYFYQLKLKVDSSVHVYNTDEISLQTSGLLGEKSIAINPKAPPPGVTPQLITTQPIYAESVDPIENAFVELSQVANNLEETLKQINAWIDQNGANLGKAIRSFDSVMAGLDETIRTVNCEKVVSSFKTAADSFSCSMEEIQQAFAEMNESAVFTNIGTVVNNLKSATHSIDLVSQDLATGKGTLGKLLKGDDMYLRVTSIMSKIDTLMNDINHYGILFHLNKNWQRIRTKRASLLNALDTPMSFKNYFETEIDEINTAMSRLSMLIDRAQESPQREEILKSNLFKKDFAELLRQVDELADNLRLYNEELIEAQGNN